MNEEYLKLKLLKEGYDKHNHRIDVEGICGGCEALREELEDLEYIVEFKKVDHIDGLNGWEEDQAIKITNADADELLREIKKFKKKTKL